MGLNIQAVDFEGWSQRPESNADLFVLFASFAGALRLGSQRFRSHAWTQAGCAPAGTSPVPGGGDGRTAAVRRPVAVRRPHPCQASGEGKTLREARAAVGATVKTVMGRRAAMTMMVCRHQPAARVAIATGTVRWSPGEEEEEEEEEEEALLPVAPLFR